MTEDDYLDYKRRERRLADWGLNDKVKWDVKVPWVNHRLGDWGSGIRSDFY